MTWRESEWPGEAGRKLKSSQEKKSRFACGSDTTFVEMTPRWPTNLIFFFEGYSSVVRSP